MKGIQGVVNGDFILMLLQEGVIISIGGEEKYMIKLEIYKKVNGKWKRIEPKREEAVYGYDGKRFRFIMPSWLCKFVFKDKEEQ